jgi:hypothetical protein
MKVRAVFQGFFSRLLRRRAGSAERVGMGWDVVREFTEVRIPHADLNLDDFWAFGRTAE